MHQQNKMEFVRLLIISSHVHTAQLTRNSLSIFGSFLKRKCTHRWGVYGKRNPGTVPHDVAHQPLFRSQLSLSIWTIFVSWCVERKVTYSPIRSDHIFIGETNYFCIVLAMKKNVKTRSWPIATKVPSYSSWCIGISWRLETIRRLQPPLSFNTTMQLQL